MNTEKQILEMAKIICFPTANKDNCEKCSFKKHCSKFDDAPDLYNAGYCKASDIFEEIEKLISSECLVIKDEAGIRGYVDASVHYILAELKKKYLGKDINVSTKESETTK